MTGVDDFFPHCPQCGRRVLIWPGHYAYPYHRRCRAYVDRVEQIRRRPL